MNPMRKVLFVAIETHLIGTCFLFTTVTVVDQHKINRDRSQGKECHKDQSAFQFLVLFLLLDSWETHGGGNIHVYTSRDCQCYSHWLRWIGPPPK